MSTIPLDGGAVDAYPTIREWNTLEELRAVAFSAGCSKAEIDETLRVCNNDLFKTATFLQILVLSRE
jgi:hypothetical protein